MKNNNLKKSIIIFQFLSILIKERTEFMNENTEILEYMEKDASMAAFTLEELLKDLNGRDNKIKDDVENILKGYERYVKEITKKLKKEKVEIKEEGFMAKMGAKMGIKKEVKHDNSDASIADMLIKGISMGTIDMEKKIKEYDGKIEKDNLKFAKEFFQFQQDNLEALKKHL